MEGIRGKQLYFAIIPAGFIDDYLIVHTVDYLFLNYYKGKKNYLKSNGFYLKIN